MIPLSTAVAELERMDGLNFKPPSLPALKEIAKAIATAETLEIATSSVSEWIEYQTKFPTPTEILALIGERNRAWRQKNKPPCTTCDGSGYIPMTGRNRATGEIVSGLMLCRCRVEEPRTDSLQPITAPMEHATRDASACLTHVLRLQT